MPFKDITYGDLLEKVYEVERWLNKIKIPRLDETRFPEIIKNLETLNVEYKKHLHGQPNNLLDLGLNISSATVEAISLNTIREGFSKLNQHHLPKRKIRDSLLGTFSSSDETGENQPRNKLFELELASYLILREINVTGFEDIEFKVDNYGVTVECKRPTSEDTLVANLFEAIDQLYKSPKKIADDFYQYGFVALSLEKVLNLDQMRFFKNKDELVQFLFSMHDYIMNILSPVWRTIRSQKIFGLILTFKTTAVFTDINQLQGINTSFVHVGTTVFNTPTRYLCGFLKTKLNNFTLDEQ